MLARVIAQAYIATMRALAACRVVFLGGILSSTGAPSVYGQSSALPDRCTAELRSTDEFKEMTGKKVWPKIIIDAVDFDGPTHVPEEERAQLVESLKRKEFDGDPKWLEEFEQQVRGFWQDRGYFKVAVTAQAQPQYGDSTYQHVAVTTHIDEGPQYRLEQIRFSESSYVSYFDHSSVNPGHPQLRKRPRREDEGAQPGSATDALLLPEPELRQLVPVADGDILVAARIRDGLHALGRAYGSRGYIDFTAIPMFDEDDAHERASLLIQIDEGPQFRYGKITILGLDPGTERTLESVVRPGDVFNETSIDQFYEQNKAVLPLDASPADIRLRRNSSESTVDATFDFRTCP